jgi:hypothetical protein
MITVEDGWTSSFIILRYLSVVPSLQSSEAPSRSQDVVLILHVSISLDTEAPPTDLTRRLPSGQEVRIIPSPSPVQVANHRPVSFVSAFKPKKVAEGTKQYQLRRYAEQTLGSGNLRSAVALPEGEDANEWIAVHGASLCHLLAAKRKRAGMGI